MKRCRYIVFLLLVGLVGQGCSSRAIHEAEAVVSQADSLWQAGQMYGIDAGDSLTLAQAYETLGAYQFLSPFTFHPSSSFTHACYHYGKLLRAKDNPVEAMQAFINATHTRTPDNHILGRVYSNMGDLCHLAGDFPLSYEMYECSGQMYLLNGDSLLYFYDLNNMAYELAEQGKKESFSLINRVDSICKNQDLLAKLLETKAVFYRETGQYDSTIFYADKSYELGNLDNAILLLKAQAYDNLGKKDSAIRYAQIILDSPYASFQNRFNALYIVKHCDSTLCAEEIEALYSQREDIRYYEYEPLKEKWLLSTQVLAQDIARRPDLRWIYTLIALILFICSSFVLVRVWRKRKLHQKISEEIEIKQNQIDTLSQRQEEHHLQLLEEIEAVCAQLNESENLKKELRWNNYSEMCEVVNLRLFGFVSHLSSFCLSEKEVRLCILILLKAGTEQMVDSIPYAKSGLGKFKLTTARKLGTTTREMRAFLLNLMS